MTDGAAIVDAVVEQVAPVVAALDLELYDVEISGSGRARILRVMIDRPAHGAGGVDGAPPAGIDLDAIAAATEAVSPVLDAPPLAKLLNGPYSLEVSSPGLERPLRTPAHFARAVGETISVKTRAEGATTRSRGQVQSAGDDTFTLLTDSGEEHTISYAEVVQARTVFEWGDSSNTSTKKASKSPSKAGAKGRKKEAVRR